MTGASSGIGLELARIFAREGHDVVLVARREGALETLAAELQGTRGVQATVLPSDLAQSGAVAAIVEQLAARGIAVDALVNNAGFGSFGFFHENDLGKELDMIRVNVLALTELTHRLLPGMLSQERGRILNVASVAAFQPGPRMAVYYATKAYVLAFSRAIANELSGTGVTVTALCPGATRTGFQAAAGIERASLLGRRNIPDAASVAEAGYRAMMKGKVLCIPGLSNWLLAQGNRFVPRRLATAVARYLQERK